MSTVADVFDFVGLLSNELDLSPGGPNEAAGIRAFKAAQIQFHNLARTQPRVLQDTITVSTVAQTETSAWASSLLRLDALWYLDDTGRPVRKLKRITEIGGHVPALPWPLLLTLPSGSGAPDGYFATYKNFYWCPLPDGIYTFRIYGMVAQAAITTRNSTFPYPDECMLAFANFIATLLGIGFGDSEQDLISLAGSMFSPLLKGLRKLDRSEPMARHYMRVHSV